MRRLGTVLIALVILALCVLGLYHIRRARLRAHYADLFRRPSVPSSPDAPSFVPRITYDLKRYNSVASDAAYAAVLPLTTGPREGRIAGHKWVDGAGRNELESRMRKRAALDGVTAATKLVRLCSPTVYREHRPSRHLHITYPLDGALFPPKLCTPCVEWDDAINDVWQITVSVEGTDLHWTDITLDRRWWFPDVAWRRIQAEGQQREISIVVKGTRRHGKAPVHAAPAVRFRIATDPCDAFIVYRLVRPPFSTLKTPDTFVRDIRSFRTRMFLSARRSYCFNCHTFSSKLGTAGKVAIQARYMLPDPTDLRTYFGIYDIANHNGVKIKLPFTTQMTTFMAWSPDGAKLAMSADQQLATLQPIVHETQFAGQPTSDIAVVDVEKRTARLLPGASDPDELEVFPRWTPDGKSIVFCWSPSGVHPALVKYDLHIVPYANGKGGTATPITGASANGRSNYYPRFSPDGKWLSFCQSDGGCLIKSSSDIVLMKSDLSGRPHRLECNAPYAADSWHSWSSNSRWIVFASKRDDGIFARLYMTHIDDQGHASPAVRLPVKTLPMQSFNIPEFIKNDPLIREGDLFRVVRAETPATPITLDREPSQ
ncbi:MAG: hypothetical protein GXP25_19980 [Planctomycetes bacterium]|nr:hypothetical protein [Planctomycetota bacterium]